jgi:hypothetical protein
MPMTILEYAGQEPPDLDQEDIPGWVLGGCGALVVFLVLLSVALFFLSATNGMQ